MKRLQKDAVTYVQWITSLCLTLTHCTFSLPQVLSPRNHLMSKQFLRSDNRCPLRICKKFETALQFQDHLPMLKMKQGPVAHQMKEDREATEELQKMCSFKVKTTDVKRVLKQANLL